MPTASCEQSEPKRRNSQQYEQLSTNHLEESVFRLEMNAFDEIHNKTFAVRFELIQFIYVFTQPNMSA